MGQDVATLVGQRVFGIAPGYEDLVDHDDLRRDPALGAALWRIEARRPGLAPLAGESTLNRLEHAPQEGSGGPDRCRRIGNEPAAIGALVVALFLITWTLPETSGSGRFGVIPSR